MVCEKFHCQLSGLKRGNVVIFAAQFPFHLSFEKKNLMMITCFFAHRGQMSLFLGCVQKRYLFKTIPQLHFIDRKNVLLAHLLKRVKDTLFIDSVIIFQLVENLSPQHTSLRVQNTLFIYRGTIILLIENLSSQHTSLRLQNTLFIDSSITFN